MSLNTQRLRDFIHDQPVGKVLEIATSEYADNTTPKGHRFDFYSTAPAVRSLIKQGFLKGESRWRYYEVEVLRSNWTTCAGMDRNHTTARRT